MRIWTVWCFQAENQPCRASCCATWGCWRLCGNGFVGGLPVFGTCAGLLLLAKQVEDGESHLAVMDIVAKRNAYGRQLGSFATRGAMADVGEIPMTFIRAPYIDSVGDGVEVLARVDGHIVAARQDAMLVTSFHPELNEDLSTHRYFLDNLVRGRRAAR